jgi:hypothetical protein
LSDLQDQGFPVVSAGLPEQESADADKYHTTGTERMINIGTRIHVILCQAILLVVPSVLFCQPDNIVKKARADSVRNKSTENNHSFYAGTGAGSNMIYLGTSISENKPFYSAAVTYGYRNSFFVSASASHLYETRPYLAFYSAALNYHHVFNSWFDIAMDAAAYKTSQVLQDSVFSDFAYLNLTSGFDWKLLYTRISVCGVISENSGLFFMISNSRYFETAGFLHGKALVYFDPDFDILLGDQATIVTTSGTPQPGKAPPFSHAGKKTGNMPDVYDERFRLMDFEISLPVTFSYGKFSLEAQPNYLIQVHSDSAYPLPSGFSFFLNAIIKIF